GEGGPGRLPRAGVALEALDGGVGGEQQVGAGVAVRDREDVELVDRVPRCGQRSDSGPAPLAGRGVVQRLEHGRRVPSGNDRAGAARVGWGRGGTVARDRLDWPTVFVRVPWAEVRSRRVRARVFWE